MRIKLLACLFAATILVTTVMVVAPFTPIQSAQAQTPLPITGFTANATKAVAGSNFDIYGTTYNAYSSASSGVPWIYTRTSGEVILSRMGILQTALSMEFVIATTTSDADGNYHFTVTEPVAGTYSYRITAGNTATKDLSVTVLDAASGGSAKTPTTLDVFSPLDQTLIVRATHQFTVVGWLTNDSAIRGASATLQQWDGTKWATIKTTTTDAQGRCSFTHSIATRGAYYVRMHNVGSNVNEASSSEFVKVTVI